FGRRRRVRPEQEPVRRVREIADQHAIEPGALVDAGGLGDDARVEGRSRRRNDLRRNPRRDPPDHFHRHDAADLSISGRDPPPDRERGSTCNIDTDRNQQHRDPVAGRRPFAEYRNRQDRGYRGTQGRERRSTARPFVSRYGSKTAPAPPTPIAATSQG